MVIDHIRVHELPIRLILALMPKFHHAFYISLKVVTEVT